MGWEHDRFKAMFLTEAVDPYEAIYTPAHPPGA